MSNAKILDFSKTFYLCALKIIKESHIETIARQLPQTEAHKSLEIEAKLIKILTKFFSGIDSFLEEFIQKNNLIEIFNEIEDEIFENMLVNDFPDEEFFIKNMCKGILITESARSIDTLQKALETSLSSIKNENMLLETNKKQINNDLEAGLLTLKKNLK